LPRALSDPKEHNVANVIALIERDHREVENLFAKFEQTGGAAVATQICDEELGSDFEAAKR
jgi:hypothetical protein